MGSGDDALRLPPEPSSVAQARAWARSVMRGRPEGAGDTVVLLVSELVTNAVLHARTSVELAVARGGESTRVDVVDGSAAMPVRKHFGAEAATGRGLQLLSTLATSWGVDALATGKRIWFEIADAPTGAVRNGPLPSGGVREVTAPDLDDWPDLDGTPVAEPAAVPTAGNSAEPAAGPTADDCAEPAAEPVAAEAAATVTLRIVGLPVAEYLNVEAHNDALVREFTLLGQSPRPDMGEIADEFVRRFGTATTPVRDQVQAAVDAGEALVDIELDVPRAAVPWLVELADRLDAADALADEGRLLTLGATERVRRFRRWYTGQLQAQAAGEPATPWPYPVG